MLTPYLQDIFVGTNGTALTSHSPQFPASASHWSTGGTTLVLQSGAAAGTTGTKENYYNIGELPSFQIDFDYLIGDVSSAVVVSANADTAGDTGIGINLLNSVGQTELFVISDGVSYVAQYDPPLDSNQHHCTLTWDGTLLRSWIDGNYLGSIAGAAAYPTGYTNLYIQVSTVSADYGDYLTNLRLTSLPTGVQPTSYWPGPLG